MQSLHHRGDCAAMEVLAAYYMCYQDYVVGVVQAFGIDDDDLDNVKTGVCMCVCARACVCACTVSMFMCVYSV